MTTASKHQVWPESDLYSLDDQDPGGAFFAIVSDSRFDGGACCRMRYPAGAFGMGSQFYQLRIKSPRTVANLEFDFLFEPGFDFAPPNAEKVGGGKIGPCINWGEVGGETAKRGTRVMFWWTGNGSNYQKTRWTPTCQDQRSGNQYIQPTVYGPLITFDQIYHFKIQILGGPQGHASWWLDDVKLADSIAGQALQVTPEDDVIFDFAFFAGGATPAYAPRWDSYARHGNVRCYSTPSASPSVQRYHLEGTFEGTMTPV